jgi:hypothetical protein
MGKRLSSGIVLVLMTIYGIGHAAGICERVGRDCIEPGETRIVDGYKVYRDCWRYKDMYRCRDFAKNNCTEYDNVVYCQLENTSCKQKLGDWCVAQNRVYKCEEEEKYIRKEKRYRLPTFKKENSSERKRVECGDTIKCIDGKCFDVAYEANDEMGKAAGVLASLKEMQEEYHVNAKVFKGEPRSCAVRAFGLNKCCNVGSKAFIEKIGLSSCKSGEREIAELRAGGKCHYVGMWKEKLLDVVGGWKKHYSYCCYGSRIAKEINAQVRKDFSDPKNPNCSGFTVEELQSVDFEKLDFSFLSEEIKSKNLWSKMGDMKKAFEHTQHLMESEIETIKSDITGNSVLVDDQKLYEKKFNEKHDDPNTQKKPDGRDKTRDTTDKNAKEYNVEIYQNRDEKGL